MSAETYRDRCLIAWSERDGSENKLPDAAWQKVLAIADWSPPVFPIKAQDALDRGASAGPGLGRLMADLEQWWIAGDFAANRAACLAELGRRLKS